MWIERYEALLRNLGPSQKGTMTEEYLLRQLALARRIADQE
jgi:hypothetical protein